MSKNLKEIYKILNSKGNGKSLITAPAGSGKTYSLSNYQKYKYELRDEAIAWQYDFEKHNYSYEELALYAEYFKARAKVYGLLKEFRENGII